MAKKKPDPGPPIETLPSGERVHIHPDGSRHLIHTDPVLERVAALTDTIHESQARLHAEHLDRVERKLAKQRAKGLPPDKSVI